MKSILIALFALVTLGACTKKLPGEVLHMHYKKMEGGCNPANCEYKTCNAEEGYHQFGPVADMCCPVCFKLNPCFNGTCTDQLMSHKPCKEELVCPDAQCTDTEIEVVPDASKGIYCKICVSVAGEVDKFKNWRKRVKSSIANENVEKIEVLEI